LNDCPMMNIHVVKSMFFVCMSNAYSLSESCR
jgi:hypothetical protein